MIYFPSEKSVTLIVKGASPALSAVAVKSVTVVKQVLGRGFAMSGAVSELVSCESGKPVSLQHMNVFPSLTYILPAKIGKATKVFSKASLRSS
jgi:hypothetical protein